MKNHAKLFAPRPINRLDNEAIMGLMANLLIDQFLKEKHLIVTSPHSGYNDNVPPLQ